MSDAPDRVTLPGLALAFNRIALSSFGGGLSAWSRQVVVEERRWMSDAEFLSAMTVCRILPGANQVNLAVFVGSKLRGLTGAVAAVAGLVAAPVALVIGLAYVYFTYHHLPAMDAALRGMTAAAVGLTFSMVYKTGRACLVSPVPWLLLGASFVMAGLLRLPLLATVGVLAPIGLWWAWPRGERA